MEQAQARELVLTRRAWFDACLAARSAPRPREPLSVTCPCCGYPTLSERAGYDICFLCGWEDDGQDEDRVGEVWGGPNGRESLVSARTHFLAHGDKRAEPDTTRIDRHRTFADVKALFDAWLAGGACPNPEHRQQAVNLWRQAHNAVYPLSPPKFVLVQRRLGEAIAWGLAHANREEPATSLRTPELDPTGLLPPPSPGAGFAPGRRRGQDSTFSGVHVLKVSEARSRLLRLADAQVSTDLHGGRILCYEPENNLFDCAARQASHGFFDVNNAPPWDTWFDYDPGAYQMQRQGSNLTTRKPAPAIVLAFVPAEFVPLAEAGIDANPEQCIRWAVPGERALGNLGRPMP